jgi:Phage Tail Collar Domain
MKTNSQQRLMATLIAIVLVASNAMAQAPQAIPYQAVVRNAAGNIVPNKLIGLRFGIRDLSAVGTRIYLEEQKATTNSLGLFVVNVGQGTLVFGYQPLSVINWENGAKFLEVEIDTTGGTTYTSLGTQQLSSVPYALNAGNGVPVGTVVAFMGNTPPPGWLLCNHAEISRTDYKNLFAVIGVSSGPGNGTTTFHIPEMRGLFLRGRDGGVNQDPDAASRTGTYGVGVTGDNVGSYQGDDFKSHRHDIQEYYSPSPGGSGKYGLISNFYSGGGCYTRPDLMSSNGGNESRPKNISVNYIIKY